MSNYFDFGSFGSSVWNFITWSNPLNKEVVDTAALNEYIDSLAQQCKAQGISEMTFSFSQVSDIQDLLNGDFKDCSPDDALGMLYNTLGGDGPHGSGDLTLPFFQQMLQELQKDGIKTSLSFGGASAGAGSTNDWNFGFSSTYSPQQAASDLTDWAKSMGFNDIDFDIESADITSKNSGSDLAAFFANLHKECSASGINTTITLEGAADTWGMEKGSILYPIFSQNIPFDQMFDAIHLMDYNTTAGVYYLNAGQGSPLEDWDLTTWVTQLMENMGLSGPSGAAKAASYLQIGFNSSINYLNPSSSAGPLPYSNFPPGVTTNGQAAGYIFAQLEKELQEYFNSPSLHLGPSFFWDDNADYQVGTNNQSLYFSQTNNFEADFWGQSRESY